MEASSCVELQCAGAYTGVVTVRSLDAPGSVAQTRQLISNLIGKWPQTAVRCKCYLDKARKLDQHKPLLTSDWVCTGESHNSCIKLIAGGRTLQVGCLQFVQRIYTVFNTVFDCVQDDTKALKDYGIHSRSRLLVMRTATAAASTKLAAQEGRAQRLARLKDAAAAVAARGDGR